MNSIYPDKRKMHGYIGSDFKYINNEFFLNLFRINYLLISDQNQNYLKIRILIELKKYQLKKENCFCLKEKFQIIQLIKKNYHN